MGHIEDQFVKSKFDTVEDEPAFDEKVHGASGSGVAGDEAESASSISNSVESEKA